MNINLPTPEHVNTVWDRDTLFWFHGLPIISTVLITMIFSICITIIICCFMAMSGKEDKTVYGMIFFFTLIASCACVIPWMKNTQNNYAHEVTVVPTSEVYKYKHNVNNLPKNIYADNTPKENFYLNKIIAEKYKLYAVDANVFATYSTNLSDINNDATNGNYYTYNEKKMRCAFNYNVTKRNNIGQMMSLKMNKVVCMSENLQTITIKK